MYNYSNNHESLPAAGYSEDSDYTSDVNFPVNGHFPNAPASQYLQVRLCIFLSLCLHWYWYCFPISPGESVKCRLPCCVLRFVYLQLDRVLSFAFVFVLVLIENQLICLFSLLLRLFRNLQLIHVTL